MKESWGEGYPFPTPQAASGRAAWWIGAVLSVPVVLAGLAALTLWFTLPPARSAVHLAGLTAPVDVTLDRWGIPRIRAATEADAAAALGYLHARDRLFQMELMRRAASGRLAEIAGPRALRLDRMARTLGERRHAEESYAALAPDLRAVLTAYAAGVNAWIAERGRLASLESLATGPAEPWTPVDSLLWSETVSLWLSDNFRSELARAALAGTVPPDKLLLLWPSEADTAAPDSTTPPGPVLPIRQGLLDALPAFPDDFTLPPEASNAWAVDGRYTASGAPLLAGDPHLSLGFPGVWYLARIETPSGVLVGATAPGVPFLIIGRNAHIAWSFTTTGIDTQDVFVETELPGGLYATPDGPQPFETRREVIHVRGAPDEVLTVRGTRHGPVLGDSGVPGDPVLAVSMAQFKLGSPAPGLWALNHAASLADAGRAAALMTAPMQNLTVADRDGIALFTTGQVPVRRAGDGSVPVAGADGRHDWIGFAGGESLPHMVHPASGTVENANERTAPPGFPVYLGRDFPGPIRARRIHALLAAKPRFGIDDFEAMQRDDFSVLAQDVLPVLRALPRQPGTAGRAQALLESWDGTMAKDRPEPLVFNAAVQLFVKQVLAANHVPEADSGPWSGFALSLLAANGGAQATFCGGDCRPALGRALHDASEDLARRFGPDPSAWRWGSVHQAVFAHPLLGGVAVLGALAGRSVAMDGDDTTLLRGGNGILGQFAALHGAAYRGVYDLADLERSRFVVAPGQSGNLLSAHAWDMLPLWASGHTVTIPASPDGVSATLRLLPR